MRNFIFGLVVGVLVAGGTTAWAQVYATVDTNGTLKGYTVQKKGKTVCKDPTVSLAFRGAGNFILCD